MFRFSLFTSVLMLTVTLAGASLVNAQSGKHAAESDKMAEPDTRHTLQLGMSGYSPVSYLDRNKAEPGSAQFNSVYQDVTYFFTSDRQRIAFDKNPQRYMPAYGGFCAFGCSVDSDFVPDPMSFEIIDGKTHLFLKNKEVDAKALWRDGDQAELIKKADAYWGKRSRSKADGKAN